MFRKYAKIVVIAFALPFFTAYGSDSTPTPGRRPWSECAIDMSGSTRPHEMTSWEPDPWGSPVWYYQGLVLKKADYFGIKETAFAIDRLAGVHPVVGIGRSPAPLTKFLSLLHGRPQFNIAMSAFRRRPESPHVRAPLPAHYARRESKFAALAPAQETVLFDYFDARLAHRLRSKIETVYLLDVGESGASVFSIQRYLERWAGARALPSGFESILVTSPEFAESARRMAGFFGVVPHILIRSDDYVAAVLRDSRWDNVAEYNGFDFDAIVRANRLSAYDRLTQTSVAFARGEPNIGHLRLDMAIKANMLFDDGIAHGAITPIDLSIPSIAWDPLHREYRKSNGSRFKLSTGD